MIDRNKELTPGLRNWWVRNKPILSEIGVWIPVVLYLALFVGIIFSVVKENPPELILRNAGRANITPALPLYGMIMHLAGLGLLGYGAFRRRLGTSTRGIVTKYGLLTSILGSSSYVQFMGQSAEASERGMAIICVYAVFSFVWLVLAVWRIRIALAEEVAP